MILLLETISGLVSSVILGLNLKTIGDKSFLYSLEFSGGGGWVGDWQQRMEQSFFWSNVLFQFHVSTDTEEAIPIKLGWPTFLAAKP